MEDVEDVSDGFAYQRGCSHSGRCDDVACESSLPLLPGTWRPTRGTAHPMPWPQLPVVDHQILGRSSLWRVGSDMTAEQSVAMCASRVDSEDSVNSDLNRGVAF